MATNVQLRVARVTLVAIVCCFAIQRPVLAQENVPLQPLLQQQPQDKNALQLQGRWHLIKGTNKGVLILHAQIPEGNYIASLQQPQNPTQLKVAPGIEFKTKGKFKADRKAQIIKHDPVMKCRIEKHRNTVQFYTDIEIADGVNPAKIKPVITFTGQVCSDQGFCVPIQGQKIAAVFDGYYQPQTAKQKILGIKR